MTTTRRMVLVAAVAAASMAAVVASHSFTNSWGRWSDASNWDTGVVPNGPDEAVSFTKGGNVTNDVPGVRVWWTPSWRERRSRSRPVWA